MKLHEKWVRGHAYTHANAYTFITDEERKMKTLKNSPRFLLSGMCCLEWLTLHCLSVNTLRLARHAVKNKTKQNKKTLIYYICWWMLLISITSAYRQFSKIDRTIALHSDLTTVVDIQTSLHHHVRVNVLCVFWSDDDATVFSICSHVVIETIYWICAVLSLAFL